MELLMTVFEWAVTITGIVALVLLGLNVAQKNNKSLIALLTKVNAVTIKVGAVSAMLFLLMIYYKLSGGAITIKAIGFYIAVGSILVTLFKSYNINTEFIQDVGSVISHKADELQKQVKEEAKKAKKG